MKDHFLKLFAYDKFVNEVILKAIIETNTPPFAEKLMAHLLSAQQVWLGRCTSVTPAEPIVLWPDWKADTFQQTISDNNQKWTDFLSGLNAEDFARTITYKNSSGDSYGSLLTDVLTQVINHGTHHRAQIGQHLKQAGLEKLPVTDYIAFLRFTALR